MVEEDRDSQHVNDMLTDTATTSKELIQSIALNIPNATQLISVRRKFLWDDYVVCRKKSWFKTNALLRVHSLVKRQWMVAGLAENSLQVNMTIVNITKKNM